MNDSLKGKRSILKPLIARIRRTFNVSICEADAPGCVDTFCAGSCLCEPRTAPWPTATWQEVAHLVEQWHGDAQLFDYTHRDARVRSRMAGLLEQLAAPPGADAVLTGEAVRARATSWIEALRPCRRWRWPAHALPPRLLRPCGISPCRPSAGRRLRRRRRYLVQATRTCCQTNWCFPWNGWLRAQFVAVDPIHLTPDRTGGRCRWQRVQEAAAAP
jgi:hypothetical protein